MINDNADNVEIREILPKDNKRISHVIKSVLTELNYNIKGTAFYDKETDAMYDAYQTKNAIYYVALLHNEVVGGCGINQLKNGDTTICELQKMYLLPKSRGKNIGQLLVTKSIDFAIKSGYEKCYLETFPEMHAAINLYRKNRFIQIKKPLGNTSHYSCNMWMLKDLKV